MRMGQVWWNEDFDAVCLRVSRTLRLGAGDQDSFALHEDCAGSGKDVRQW